MSSNREDGGRSWNLGGLNAKGKYVFTEGSVRTWPIVEELACPYFKPRRRESRIPLRLNNGEGNEEMYCAVRVYCRLTQGLCVGDAGEKSLLDPTLAPEIVGRCPRYIESRTAWERADCDGRTAWERAERDD